MKLVVLGILWVIVIYNFYLIKNTIVFIKKKPIYILITSLFAIVSYYLCYKYDGTKLGYIIVFLAVIAVISYIFTPGITKNGINVMFGTTHLIKHINYENIKDISYSDKNNDEFEIKYKAYGNEFTQVYDYKDKSKVIDILKLQS